MSITAPQIAETTPRLRLRGFLRLARLKFLLYNVLPVGLGAAAAVALGSSLNVWLYVVAQVFAWTVHLMTHYCNEYFDLEADRANVYHTPWTGGSRALVDGLVSPIVSLGASFVLWAAGLFIVALMPTPAARIAGVVTLVLAWFYTAPPLQFNYRGLGEVTVAAILNGLWPVVAVLLQSNTVPWLLVATLAPTALLQAARMMVMNLGDRISDASVGKRTIPVIIGYAAAVRVVIAAQIAAYALLTAFAVAGWVPWLVWAPMFATVPLSVWLVDQLRRGAMAHADPSRMTPVVFWASNHVALVVGGAMLGMVVYGANHGANAADVGILSGVLLAYALLFAYRLRAARRSQH